MKGLKPGERVIAEGVQKVRQGMVVNRKPFGRRTGGQDAGAPAKTRNKAPDAGQGREKR